MAEKSTTQRAAADQQADVEAQKEGGDFGDAQVLGSDKEVSSSLYATADEGDEFVTLKGDVVEEFYYPDTQRPAYRVLYTKGQVVRKSAIDAHNEAVKARAAVREGKPADPKNPLGIDSSTVASGTRVEPVGDSKK